jgi:hypothetical protein
MRNSTVVILSFVISIFSLNASAQKISGQVTEVNGKPLPFATIKFGNTGNGMIADLEGKFSFHTRPDYNFIEVSYLNFETKKILLTADSMQLLIILSPVNAVLKDVVIRSKSNKLKRILNNVVAHRNQNNPDKYDWYQCKVYYKMVVDAHFDSVIQAKDTTHPPGLIDALNENHAFITETYSKRTWAKPQRLQEEVYATKMSGLKKAVSPNLITDVLPFHAYTEFIKLSEKDYYSPITPGLFQRFDFKLKDEIKNGKDTVWVISFTPKIEQQLRGVLYINSNNYAVAHIIAHSIDTVLHKDLGFEQQYSFTNGRWFPQQLNFTSKIDVPFPPVSFTMKGVSLIDSVSFIRDERFHFDKAHTIILQNGADERSDSNWLSFRSIPLENKEAHSYAFMDSLFKASGLQKLFNIGSTLQEGKIPWKIFDFNLDRFYSNNSYEGSRFGLGVQTNQKLWKHFSVGGWAGYGIKDKLWKYGAFSEIYFDPPRKEFVIRGSYYNDVRPPGQSESRSGMQNNLLRQMQLQGVDKVEGFSFSVKKKFGYLSAEMIATDEKTNPLYAYQFDHAGKNFHQFESKQVALNLRYAWGERTAPVYGRYASMVDSRYPILYAGITRGTIVDPSIAYTQLTAGISFKRHINRFGEENILLLGGRSFSNSALPVQKLFSGNAFSSSGYFFGSMQTMPAGQYFSDQFINAYWLHQFDFRFYTLNMQKKKLVSAPSPALGYNMLWGTLKNINAHSLLTIKVAEPAYHEAGFIINNILKAKIFGIGYIKLNAGYFHQLSKNNNGKFVFGTQLEF